MLHLQGISKQYGSKILFENVDANLTHRSKAALVGPNGAGKSTLIKMILGQETPDAGHISKANHLAIGHLAQEVPRFGGRTVLEEVTRLDGRRDELNLNKQELEDLFAKDANAQADEQLLERYGRVLEELDGLDEARLEANAKAILTGMGFKLTDLQRSLTEFSGGWLMRVALSRILLMEPDLLLLDEPTNHLDLESLLWLENFLQNFRGALLLISHDTEFLNRMVNEVLEIDQKRVFSYRGNLDAWRTQKAERLEVMKSQAKGQEARIAELERFIERFGAKATKARQAQSRAKQLEKIQAERIELPEDRATVRFRFPPAPHSGKEVVTMKGASFSYGDKPVYDHLDWIIPRGSRLAIVGPNGAGKTTLLKILAGQLPITDGTLKLGHEVKIGYYAQHQADQLDLSKTVLQELEQTAPDMPIAQVRAVAGAFLFSGDAVSKKCGVLSGGEKARVALAKMLLQPSNFLLLDEPTNHLDVESRGVLLEALQDYEGTLCLVSHDRSFMSPLVDSVLEIQPQGVGKASRVDRLVGTYDEYVERKRREMADQSRADRGEKPSAKPSAKNVAQTTAAPLAAKPAISNNQRRALEKERETLETTDIPKLEARQAELGALLSDEQIYADKPRFMKLLDEQRALESDLTQNWARLEELYALLEPQPGS